MSITLQLVLDSIAPRCPRNLGPLESGVFIPVAAGAGFYVPELEYHELKALATATKRVQFLGVTKDGRCLFGTREQILDSPESAGLVAWIHPE